MLPDIVENTYKESNNYKITIGDNKGCKRCFIFFSGNGLYYPETEEEFLKTIVVKDRYEWNKYRPKNFSKLIQLRDVKKTWYLDGINQHLNTIDKVASFLKEETKGLEVICVGSSAGGYAAVLFGSLLRASHIFTFSGQFSLFNVPDSWSDDSFRPWLGAPLLSNYKNIYEYSKFYDLRSIILQSKVPIFYFYPAFFKEDTDQHDLILDIDCIRSLTFSSNSHGVTCLLINYPDLFDMNLSKLDKLYQRYQGKLIGSFLFSLHISGLLKTSKYLFDPKNRYLVNDKLKKFFRNIN